MSFHDNLKILRKSKGFTQAELAKIVGISQPTLAQYELGIKFPTIIVAVRLEKILCVTCRDMVDGTFSVDKGDVKHD